MSEGRDPVDIIPECDGRVGAMHRGTASGSSLAGNLKGKSKSS